MISIRKQFLICVGIVLLIKASSMPAMHFPNFYEVYYRQVFNLERRTNIAFMTEGGITSRSFDRHSNCVNVLQIWNATQSSLNMLKGFDEDSQESIKLSAIDAQDDGVRGHFRVTGNLCNIVSGAFATRVGIADGFMLGLYLPVSHAHLDDVCWHDLTQNNSLQDLRVKEELTDNIFATLYDLDPTLDAAHGWSRTGVGDLTLLMEWQQDFPQPKPVLKRVRINTRLGMSFPTGLRTDVDKLFAFPFGYDGATGLIFGGSLGVNFMHAMWAGFDVELTHLFDNVSTRRIRTDMDQTDLLLLAKACVHNDWGTIQRFNLFLDVDHFFKGLSCAVFYQFLKHGQVYLTVNSNDFDTNIANTADYLKEWTSHTAIFRAMYDFSVHLPKDTRVQPSLALFARVPFKGRCAALWTTLGVMFDIAF